MKHKITLSIALVMSLVLISLIGSATTANAAPQPQRFVADTGTVPLGPNQLLRLTVAPPPGLEVVTVEYMYITWTNYQHGACNDSGVCMHTILSQNTTDPVMLRRGEAVSMDITQSPNGSAVRGLVYLTSNDLEVNMQVVDIITGATLSSSHVRVFDGRTGGYLQFSRS
jgi:hypothetical protein